MTTQRDTTQPAGGSPVERGVGRPADDATDTSGPRGTYGCACAHHDGSMCAWIRYGGDGPEDPCEFDNMTSGLTRQTDKERLMVDALTLAVQAMRAPLDDWKGELERKALDAARAVLGAA